MAAPQDSGNGVEKLFPELSDGSSQPDPAGTGAAPALPLPPITAAAGAPSGGTGSVMYRHDKLRQIVANMRQDLQSLQTACTALDDRSMGHGVGQWDVAKSLGTKVGAAHQNMLHCIKAYSEAYNAVIRRLEGTMATYATAEDHATRQILASAPQAADDVRPWPIG